MKKDKVRQLKTGKESLLTVTINVDENFINTFVFQSLKKKMKKKKKFIEKFIENYFVFTNIFQNFKLKEFLVNQNMD